MFCTNCGAQLPNDAKFCPTCGSQVALGAFNAKNCLRTDDDSEVMSGYGKEGRSNRASDEANTCLIQYATEEVNTLIQDTPHVLKLSDTSELRDRFLTQNKKLCWIVIAILIVLTLLIGTLRKQKENAPFKNIPAPSREIGPTEFDGVYENIADSSEKLEIDWGDWSLVLSCYNSKKTHYTSVMITPYVFGEINDTTIDMNRLELSPETIDGVLGESSLEYTYHINFYYVPKEDSPYNVDTIYTLSEDFKNAIYVRIKDADISDNFVEDDGEYESEYADGYNTSMSTFQMKREAEINTQYLSIEDLVRNPTAILMASYTEFRARLVTSVRTWKKPSAF